MSRTDTAACRCGQPLVPTQASSGSDAKIAASDQSTCRRYQARIRCGCGDVPTALPTSLASYDVAINGFTANNGFE